jgi:hypothetical protein
LPIFTVVLDLRYTERASPVLKQLVLDAEALEGPGAAASNVAGDLQAVTYTG